MSDRSRGRLLILQVLVATMVLTLFGRLWFLQIQHGQFYVEQAAANRIRDLVIPAVRGEIYDSAGRVLIDNRTALVVSVDRSKLADQPDEGTAVLARLAGVLDRPLPVLIAAITPCGELLGDGRKARSTVDGCWTGSPYQPIPVASYDATDEASRRVVLRIEEAQEDFPGVTVDLRAVRDYPRGTLAAHLLGHLGPIAADEVGTPAFAGVQDTALVGRGGVEQVYEQRLRGTDGVRHLLVDTGGNVTGTAGQRSPRPGDKLVLSIDAGVQALAERELLRAIAQARERPYYRGGMTRADSGSIVVMEVDTGRVIALASYPTYQPDLFTGGISSRDYQRLISERRGQPLLFRAIAGGYAPASTFKVIAATAAVMNGQTTFDTVAACPAVFGPTGQQNFAGRGSPPVSLRRAIVQSCDTSFYKLAYDAWVADGGIHPVADPQDPMITMALAFGLGEQTGIDLPAEGSGLIPTRQWRKDYWAALKDDFCQGARNPAYGAARRARDKDLCLDGFRFRGGQATNFAIGQGETLVTPLQLASVYATIAGGGKVMRPTVAKGFLSADGSVREMVPTTVTARVPVRPSVLARLRDALHGVTSEPGGTARRAFEGLDLAVAGKTGTGEVNGKQDTSWFASFAPYDDPQLVVVGMVSQGGTGATTAAPMVREVYEGIFGLDGKAALLPGGQSPIELPVVRADGTLARPSR